ncbi:AraC family transcriptional regulator [Paenibacillus lemnae]|uniref:AraC family transcriptional regulator n=1 Tax=Paenibacillus lemnae TaxID=1330551 RepID=A0A848M592_PAELE|nr:AraC family transcriptional regulator [Paenibacillus lemnae]NMO95429.1 AraC family transcriptional regulator [Paenibacillus lemnae]
MDSQGIAVSMVYPVMKALVHKGYDVEEFFEFAGFDGEVLQNMEGRLDRSDFEKLVTAAAAYTGDDHFGLHQGQIMDFEDMGILGYVMLHSKTISDALKSYQRYNMLLCSGFNLDWEVSGENLMLRLFLQSPGGTLSRHCAEDMAGSLFHMISRLSNRSISLRDVWFCHEQPSDIEPYMGIFGRYPVFGTEYHALFMDKEILSYPVLYSDPKLLQMFENMAEASRGELNHQRPFTEQVSLWMKKCIPSYLPTLQQTAQHFAISMRTLQLRLREEGTSFHELSAAVRKELAISYLKERGYAVGDIAYLLHFSEPSAFHNAFKKWTGMTPGQFRAADNPVYD